MAGAQAAGAVADGVREAGVAQEVGVRDDVDRAAGQRDRGVARAPHRRDREDVDVDVGVIGQERGREDIQRGVLVGRQGVGDRGAGPGWCAVFCLNTPASLRTCASPK